MKVLISTSGSVIFFIHSIAPALERSQTIPNVSFNTIDGAYEFLQMPFGLKNSGATYVCGIREVLLGMSGDERYIDFLIVFSSNWKTQIKIFKKPIRRLSDTNLTNRPSKCIFRASTVEFLGHDVGYD